MTVAESGQVPRPVQALIVSFVPLYLAQGFLTIVIGAWLVTVGFTAVQAGTLIALEGVTFILTSIPLGVASDVYGRKTLLLLGAFSGAAGFLAFSLTTSFEVMAGICALLGFSEAASLTTWNALLADMTDGSNRNKAFSLSFVVSNLSTGAGLLLPGTFPLFEGYLGLTNYSLHRDALFVIGLAAFVAPFASMAVLRRVAESHREGGSAGTRDWSTLAKLSFVGSTIGLGAGFVVPLIGSWFFFRFGVPDSSSGPILALSNILIGSSAVASPWLAARFGQLKAILLTTGSSMVFMVSMAFVPSFAIAAGVYVVRSGLMNMSGPLMDSFSMSIFPPQQRGVVSAVSNIMFRLPNSLSTYFGGLILAAGFLQLPFFVAGSLYLVGLGGFYAFFVARGTYPRHPVYTEPEA